ncbi:MAG: sortase family protein LPXTG-site transpeptidase [Cellvibrio sp.]|nr:sortase family protein LPXTG-site transpeptidase [Cellvibrio sp.]
MESNCFFAKPALGVRSTSLLYRGLEVFCWGLGLALLGYALMAKIHGAEASDAGLRAFASAAANDVADSNSSDAPDSLLNVEALQHLDQSLWSKKRIAQFTDIHNTDKETPLAVLRIDDLRIVVPIYSGATDFNLNRGAGWIEETAPVDGRGNIGIAAHRDSFFRALKDARRGQKMTLQTLQGTRYFTLANIQIINPSEISVLEPSSSSKLTLVTCYPFYHVGSAPQRYIVTATEDISAPKPKE